MQSPCVLVAGGTGFIGGHLAATLIERGVAVVALDNGLFAPASIVETIRPTSLFIRVQADARSEHEIIEAMRSYRVSAVVNCVGDYERIQNAGNLPYDCFRHFFEKWSTSYDFIWKVSPLFSWALV